ncbi:hypothetical protein Hanom_Chr07g00589711 [Helianthus anomalus]
MFLRLLLTTLWFLFRTFGISFVVKHFVIELRSQPKRFTLLGIEPISTGLPNSILAIIRFNLICLYDSRLIVDILF